MLQGEVMLSTSRGWWGDGNTMGVSGLIQQMDWEQAEHDASHEEITQSCVVWVCVCVCVCVCSVWGSEELCISWPDVKEQMRVGRAASSVSCVTLPPRLPLLSAQHQPLPLCYWGEVCLTVEKQERMWWKRTRCERETVQGGKLTHDWDGKETNKILLSQIWFDLRLNPRTQ